MHGDLAEIKSLRYGNVVEFERHRGRERERKKRESEKERERVSKRARLRGNLRAVFFVLSLRHSHSSMDVFCDHSQVPWEAL